MPLQPSPELHTSASTLWWRIPGKPSVHQTVRSAEDVSATTTWSDVSQHRVYLHAGRRQQAAFVIAINVPTRAGQIPGIPRGELEEKCTPITRSFPGLSFQYLVDRADRMLAPDSAKTGSLFTCSRCSGRAVVQVDGSLRRIPTLASAAQMTSHISAASSALKAPGIRAHP
jgi:hypothetical protein